MRKGGDERQGDGRTVLDLRPTDRGATAPLWTQVKASLTMLIFDRNLPPDTRLPSEAELCREFGVSRTVVREALAQMVNEGLIYRLQGKGAFVRAPRDGQDFISTTVGFSGELVEKHHIVMRRTLSQTKTVPRPRVRQYLQLGEDDESVVIDRVMMVDGKPRAIVRWAMLASIVPGLENVALEKRSLYDTISRQYGIRLNRAERWIEAISLGVADAALLEVEPGRAALQVESVASDGRGRPVEYYTALYLTDRARLHIAVHALGN